MNLTHAPSHRPPLRRQLGLLFIFACESICAAPALDFVFACQDPIANQLLHPPPPVVGDFKPNTLLAGDWNKDGNQDFAAANSFDHSISIFAGDGAGRFRLLSVAPAPRRPIGLLAGDWNEDGHTDLAVTSYNEAGVGLLLGNGAGAFRTGGFVTSGHSPQAAISGDWDSDGRLDLAISNRNDHTVSIALGEANGRFNRESVAEAGSVAVGKFPSGLTAGDWNTDGNPDLAVVNHYGHSISILLGNGQGRFSNVHAVAIGLFPGDIDSADVNGDGVLDLVAVNVRSGDLSILHGLGDGTFAEHSRLKAGAAPAGIALSDLDRDGAIDIAVVMRDAPELVIFRNEFASAARFRRTAVLSTGANPIDVAVGDFNSDEIPDLLVFTPGANAFVVCINRSRQAIDAGAGR